MQAGDLFLRLLSGERLGQATAAARRFVACSRKASERNAERSAVASQIAVDTSVGCSSPRAPKLATVA